MPVEEGRREVTDLEDDVDTALFGAEDALGAVKSRVAQAPGGLRGWRR
jgi:hypothetical protein